MTWLWKSRDRQCLVHYDILCRLSPLAPTRRSQTPSQTAIDGAPKGSEPIRRKAGQHDGNRLPKPESAGERCAAQDERREETKLDAVGLVVCDAVASEAVCEASGLALVQLILSRG